MAKHGAEEEYPWDSYDSDTRRSTLAIRMPSVSDMSSGGASRGSILSLPSSNEEPRCKDDINISHVRLSTAVASGVVSLLERDEYMPVTIPEILRVGNKSPLPSRSAFNPFRKPSISYEPIPAVALRQTANTGSKRLSTKRNGSFLARGHKSIPEEDIDMGLLNSAMPMGYSKANTTGIRGFDEQEHPILSPSADATFDIASLADPTTEAQVRDAKLQEAAGILTGGLGAGLKPDATLTSRDLLASRPMTPQSPLTSQFSLSPVSLTRRMTRRISRQGSGLGQQTTLRDLGQIEANKRGEIIEVIMEEEPANPATISEESEQAREPATREGPFVDSK